jgi:hypothetical protein
LSEENKDRFSILDEIDFTKEIISESEVTTKVKPTSKRDSERELNRLIRDGLISDEREIYNYLKKLMFPNGFKWVKPSILPKHKGGETVKDAFKDYFPLFDIYMIKKSIFENHNKKEFTELFKFVSKVLHLSFWNELTIDEVNQTFKLDWSSNKEEQEKKGNTRLKYERGFSNYFLVDGKKQLGKMQDNGRISGILQELLDFDVIKMSKTSITIDLTNSSDELTAKYKKYADLYFKDGNLINYVKYGLTVWSKHPTIKNKRLRKIIWSNRLTNLVKYHLKEIKKTYPITKFDDFIKLMIGLYDCEYTTCKCKA